jgi:hypothetical protein
VEATFARGFFETGIFWSSIPSSPSPGLQTGYPVLGDDP